MTSRPKYPQVQITPAPQLPERPLRNPWDSPTTPTRQRALSSATPPSSYYGSGQMPFPEPQVFRAFSASATRPAAPPKLPHKHSRSEIPPTSLRSQPSSISLASSYYQYGDDDYATGSTESHGDTEDTQELSEAALLSEEGITRFQSGKLPEKDEEWYRLVPVEARDALGKDEVQRQSVIFEVFKAERDYVFDLEAIRDVYIEPLRQSNPPIIDPSRLPGFISEVFGNLSQILGYHQRMLGALFSRQREQHPLVQSLADIVLDTTLKADFRASYETYIKHYPLAESHHRKELKRNPAYQEFCQSVSTDPRIRKRDLITFLSRPVTRLPRLNLLLEQILKLTDKDYEHPDIETLPIILGILRDCIKSTQPGIEAAESKVKFWALCESLVYQKGEIIDMDLYDESRTLVYIGPVVRHSRNESGWSGWSDLTAALLDNYFILTREETRPNGVTKRYLMSRPLPLSYLRLGSFDTPQETRKERSGLRHHSVPIYPFTIYHAANSLNRRYTLYVTTEAVRRKWHAHFVDAIAVHKARQDGNMYFEPSTLAGRFFRSGGSKPSKTAERPITGKITSAVPFAVSGRRFVAAGCPAGIFVASKGSEDFKRILNHPNPISMAAIQTDRRRAFNKFLFHADGSLLSYPLDLVAGAALGDVQPKTLESSREKIAGADKNVLFFRHAHVGQRALVIYASKKLLSVTPTINALEVLDNSDSRIVPRRESSNSSKGYRPFGDTAYVPKDAYDLTPLVKTVGVCTSDGIVILDPTNLANSAITVVPDYSTASNNLPMSNLKARTEGAKPLGLIRSSAAELLVVYDTIGCYISKHGVPTRSSGFIKWEVKADSFACRGVHVLLFSPQFIEIRNVTTGRLVQTIEAADIRLMYCPFVKVASEDAILVATRGEVDEKEGVYDKLVQLVETSEIQQVVPTPSSSMAASALWEEWDM